LSFVWRTNGTSRLMGAQTAPLDRTYYNSHLVTIYPERQPLGPACLCSKCGKAINDPQHIPVRVTAKDEPGEMRFHGHCYKSILEETNNELITSPSTGAQTQ